MAATSAFSSLSSATCLAASWSAWSSSRNIFAVRCSPPISSSTAALEKQLHRITAGIFLITRAAAEGVRVWAVAIVISIALGTGGVTSVAIVMALTLIYTFEGGMAAVIWTDVVQLAIYVGGTIIGFFTLLHLVPGGWPAIHAVASSAGKLQVFDFSLNFFKTYTFWAGLIGGMFLNTATHGTDQLMVQRLLVARNQRDSRTALLFSGGVILIPVHAVSAGRRGTLGLLSPVSSHRPLRHQ